MANFFELLNQPLSFNLDLNHLEVAFIQAQKQMHPDNFINDSGIDLNYQQAQSALINQAYMTLRDPFQRGVYYLKLYNVAIDDAGPMAPAFLMQQMEVRENLEQAHTPELKIELWAQIREIMDAHYIVLHKLLLEPTGENLQSAARILKELQFWKNIESHRN